MNALEIKQALGAKGYSLRMLAAALDVHPATVSQTINRNGTSHRVARAIAKVLDCDLYQVFPDYRDCYPIPERKSEVIENLRKIIG